MPVRKIPKNFRFLTGVSSGSKGIGKSSFESALERDLLILLEFDPDVLEYEVQPIRIPVIDLKGKPRFFTPDVRIVYRPEATSPWRGKTLIVEVKCLQDLRDGKNNILGKMRAGVSWCRKNGAIFKVFTESHIRTPLLQNARFLLPCRRIVPDNEDILRLLDALRRSDGSSPKVLLDTISTDQEVRLRFLSTLWHLVALGRLDADLSHPLTQETPLWIPPVQEGAHEHE